MVCIRAPAGRAPECFEDGMVSDRYTANLVGPIEAVLTVKTLAGNFPVNCSSLSNSSSVGGPGEFQFAPHCVPPSRSALTAEAGTALRERLSKMPGSRSRLFRSHALYQLLA